MIEKRLKNIWKLSILIGVRQGYFLARNWYLLIREPYLTLKEIKDKGDKSQFFLVTLSALTPVFVYIAARIIYDLIKYQRIVWLTGRVFGAAMLIQTIILAYLGYWTIQVLWKDR